MEPPSTDLRQPPLCYAALKALLEQYGPPGSEWRGPAYYFPANLPRSANSVLISEANIQLLQRQPNFSWFTIPSDTQPCVATVEDGQAVAICFSSRTSQHAAEAGVETLEAFRRRGYATAAVAGWAAAVRELGRIPLYSTSWDNLASQGVARRLGLVCYGEDVSLE